MTKPTACERPGEERRSNDLQESLPEVGRDTSIDRFIHFDREEWKALRANTPLLLDEQDVISLRGIQEQVSLSEVADIYVPLSRLLNLHVAAVQHLFHARRAFMGKPSNEKVPYVIGIAGSVAVGKSTFSRVLRASLARWPDHSTVELVTTDGFLYPNRILEERGLMRRKGFPESYDQRRLIRFLADVKAGARATAVPVYSHLHYDIMPGEAVEVHRPDILILEGLNVLQSPEAQRNSAKLFVSDFFDFSIYIDAADHTIERWYVERFVRLRETVFQNRNSYFHRYAALSEAEAISTAERIWREINLPNLQENILPTRERADLILKKERSHQIGEILLRRV